MEFQIKWPPLREKYVVQNHLPCLPFKYSLFAIEICNMTFINFSFQHYVDATAWWDPIPNDYWIRNFPMSPCLNEVPNQKGTFI